MNLKRSYRRFYTLFSCWQTKSSTLVPCMTNFIPISEITIRSLLSFLCFILILKMMNPHYYWYCYRSLFLYALIHSDSIVFCFSSSVVLLFHFIFPLETSHHLPEIVPNTPLKCPPQFPEQVAE